MCECNRISFSLGEEKEVLLFVTVWMSPEGVTMGGNLSRKVHTVRSHLCVRSEDSEVKITEKPVVGFGTRGQCRRGNQRTQAVSSRVDN